MAAFSYSYKTQGLFKTPADVAGRVCQQLQESEKGLTPATLLEASRSIDAPLHVEFEWDNDVAAEKYRLNQAQKIIQNIVIVTDTVDGAEAHQDRAFVITPGGRTNYVSLQSALSNDEWRKHLLAEAKRELMNFTQKYRRFQELANVNAAIDEYVSAS